MPVEWDWYEPGPPGGVEPRPLCRERDCYHHDGQGCTFAWIEPPAERGPLDRGLCRNFLIAHGQKWLARINAIH
ncbi:MAG TPA: hypothetical protein VIL95_01670 [Bacillota bacterium]